MTEPVGIDLSALLSAGGDVVKEFLADYVKGMLIETSYTEPLIIEKPFAPSPGPKKSGLGDEIRPRIVFLLKDGATLSTAPFGEPDPSKRERIYWAAGGIGILGAGALYLMLKKR